MGTLAGTQRFGIMAQGVAMAPRPKPIISLEAKQLKELRETAGITQPVLAEAMKLNQKTIEAIENGRKFITEDIQRSWRRAVKRLAWARAVAVGAVPSTAARPQFLEDTEVPSVSEAPDPE